MQIDREIDEAVMVGHGDRRDRDIEIVQGDVVAQAFEQAPLAARLRECGLGSGQPADEHGKCADVRPEVDEMEIVADARAQNRQLVGVEELRRDHQAALARVIADVEAHALPERGHVDGTMGRAAKQRTQPAR